MILVRLLPCVMLFFASANMYAQTWQQHLDSAKHYQDQRNNPVALKFYLLGRAALPSDSVRSVTAIGILKNTSRLYQQTGNARAMADILLEARAVIESVKGKSTLDYATNSDDLGVAYFNINYDSAIYYTEEAREIKKALSGTETLDYAKSENNLALFYYSIGKYSKAEEYGLHALEVRAKLLPTKESNDYAQSLNTLANIYRDQGLYEKAEPYSIEAKEIRQRILPQHPVYAISTVNLANLYFELGQYKKAEQLYIEAKDLREKVMTKSHPEYANVTNKLADLFAVTGEYEKAEALYLEAKDIREKILGKDNFNYAQSANNLASLYRQMKMYDKALPLAIEANEIWTKQFDANDPVIAYSLTNLGQIYFLSNNLPKAEKYFLDARVIWKNSVGTDHPLYNQNTAELARLNWKKGNKAAADKFFVESFNKQKSQLDKIFRFTSEVEKQQYLDNITGSTDEYFSFHQQQMPRTKAGNIYTTSLMNRNLVLSSSQQLRERVNASDDETMQAKYDEWIIARQKLARFYSTPGNVDSTEVANLESRATVLEKDLTRIVSAANNTSSFGDWKSIKAALATNEASVEFIRYQVHRSDRTEDSVMYAAVLLKKNIAEPILIPLFENERFQKLLKQQSPSQINALYRGGERGGQRMPVSKEMFGMIWLPLEKHLGGIKTIYFAPAGDLYKISFAALALNDKQVLSDKYKLVQLNSTSSVIEKTRDIITANDNIRLYGGISYQGDSSGNSNSIVNATTSAAVFASVGKMTRGGSDWDYLPGTEKEVNDLKTIAVNQLADRISVLTGSEATEESFKKLNGKNSPAVLHVATHGFFFPDPDAATDKSKTGSDRGKVFRESRNPLLRSGLLFAGANLAWQGKTISGTDDGVLTAYEVSNMYLPNTKLVVLSACETALGDIHASEGVYGLQRAFKMAGVKNLVMSLWEVPDEETSEFMKEFYSGMFNKKTVADAFYAAQTKLKNKYRSEPFKWAAWVMVR